MSEEEKTKTRLSVVFLRVPRTMKQRLEEFAISDDTSLNKLANRIFEEWEQRQPPPSISYKQEGKQGEIDERQIQGNNGVQGIQA